MTAARALAVSVLTLVPVKGRGAFVHFVRRNEKLGLTTSLAALCGKLGPLTARNVPTWRRVRTAARVCQVCHVKACSLNARIDWS
jgi:hypothetical protein